MSHPDVALRQKRLSSSEEWVSLAAARRAAAKSAREHAAELRSTAADFSSREESLSEIPHRHAEQHEHLEEDQEQEQNHNARIVSREGPDRRKAAARTIDDSGVRRMPPSRDIRGDQATSLTRAQQAQQARADEQAEQAEHEKQEEQEEQERAEEASREDSGGGGRGAGAEAVLSSNAWALVVADALAAAFAALSLARLSPAAKGADADAPDAPAALLWPAALRTFGGGLLFLLALDYVCGYTFPAHFPA